MRKELPRLSNIPVQHADCCAALSSILVAKVAQSLPSGPALTISIGSGRGILEALILRDRPEICLQAIELSHDINQYLSAENVQIVSGTWDLCALAANSTAWIFVYPREFPLVEKYLQIFGSAAVQLFIFLGPKADVPNMEALMESRAWKMEVIDECGVSQYEALLVWKRNNRNA